MRDFTSESSPLNPLLSSRITFRGPSVVSHQRFHTHIIIRPLKVDHTPSFMSVLFPRRLRNPMGGTLEQPVRKSHHRISEIDNGTAFLWENPFPSLIEVDLKTANVMEQDGKRSEISVRSGTQSWGGFWHWGGFDYAELVPCGAVERVQRWK